VRVIGGSARRRRRYEYFLCAAFLGAAGFAGLDRAEAASARSGQILLQADEIIYDSQGGTITAHGHVEISDEDRTLRADDVVFDQKADKVLANGNVSLQDSTGNTAFADSVELTRDLREGALNGFAAIIGETGRVAAASGERREGRFTIANAAIFTPCALCQDEGGRMPLWQVRASRVIHDQMEKTFYFNDATFLFMGVPVFYLPSFSQSDPSVRHKSGFLLPEIGTSTYLGSYAKIPYYMALSPSRDLTIQPFLTTGAANVVRGEYRQRLSDGGGFWLQGSLGYDSNAGNNPQRSAWLSSLFGSGRIPLRNGWRAGYDVQLSSNDTYLWRYEISFADRLTNNVFAEHVSGRNRFGIDGFFFQSLRTRDAPGRIPFVLPLVEYSYIPDRKIGGGRLRLDTNAAALQRDVGTDVVRGSLGADWRRPFMTGSGQLITLQGIVRGDMYHVENARIDVATATRDTATIGRALGLAMAEWRWPFVGQAPIANTKLILEPIAQLVAASGGGNPAGVPNEDSRTFEFDATNLFRANPTPGYDLWTGGTRSNAGVRMTALLPRGSIETTLGQDFRTTKEISFAPGSGFGGYQSDTVGQIKIQFPPNFTFIERFNISPEDGSLRRNEFYLRGDFGRSVVNFSYLKLPPNAANPTLGIQEQITLNTSLIVYRNWGVFADARRDLSSGRMIESGIGLRYEDECFVFAFGFTRREITTVNLKPASYAVLRIGLKTGFMGG
jgi:LPS-assembly protein